MTDAYVSVGGVPAQTIRVIVGNVGAWHVLADLESDAPLSGMVRVVIGGLVLVGTVDPAYDGVYDLQRKCRVVAGAGSWGHPVSSRGYHNDAGVKARLVADDVASAVGETIGTFTPAHERVGLDYAREAGPAVRTLEDAAGGVPWWVDYAGITHVGVRPPLPTADTNGYEVVAYDPRARIATLAILDPTAVSIGSVIANGLPEALPVRQFELTVNASETRAQVWLGGDESSPDRLLGLMQAIARRATDSKLHGPWRYRIVRMKSDGRADLQPVRPDAGLPDLGPIEIWAGVAGSHAQLAPGAHVLVQFIEGDRAQPVVTHVTPRGGAGWIPTQLVLGGEEGQLAARQNDAVEVLLPPAVFSGTISGSPASGVLTFPTMKAVGIITGGSAKVRIA